MLYSCGEFPVPDTRELRADFGEARTVTDRERNTRAGFLARQYFAPGVHDHAVAPGLAPAGMTPALGGGDDVSKVLHRASTHQNLPVGPAGERGERRRHGKNFRAAVEHGAAKVWKAQVVAHRQPQLAKGRVRDNDLTAGFKRGGLTILLALLKIAAE